MFVRFVVTTLSQQMKARVYTPSDGELPAYRVTDAFFNDNPKRRIAIRESLPGELENGHETASGLGLGTLYAQRPPLWMLVLSSGNGVYRVFPVYRGSNYFPVVCACQGTFAKCCNDDACLVLFDEFDTRGGLDAEEYTAWQNKWTEAYQHSAGMQQAKLNAPEMVH